MRTEAIQHSPKSLMQLPRSTEERSHASPRSTPLLPLKFKNTFAFALLRYRKIPRKHQSTPKNSLFLPLFSPFCPHSVLSRCSGPAGVVPMLLAYQDREEGRNGSPFAPVAGGPQVLRGPRQDRGREATHHPTKRGTQQDQPPRWCRSAPDAASQ